MKEDMKEQLRSELQRLQATSSGGNLPPETVVEYARTHPTSALHSYFEWDDKKAAYEARLARARGLIKVHLTVLPNRPVPVTAFVSVPEDRKNGDGYRTVEDVLASKTYRQQMIEDALARAAGLRKSYAYLSELDPFFDALDRLIAEARQTLLVQAAEVEEHDAVAA